MQISIIIPTLNEAENLPRLIPFLQAHAQGKVADIWVVDACSTDQTREVAWELGARVLEASCKGRGPQMNQGAAVATGKILYFVHADTLPPDSYVNDILAAVAAGFDLGCYRSRFDRDTLPMRINAYMTRFDRIFFRGGDQTLFIRKEVFENLRGYREDYQIMEEYEFLIRARKQYQFQIMPKSTLISTRKYEENSYFWVNFSHLIIFLMFGLGFSQQSMVRTYKYLLNYRN